MDPLWADSVWTASWFGPWAWAALLLVLGLGLAVLEVFIPSGGILGFLAVSAIIAAVVLGFTDPRPWVGFATLAAAVIGLPGAIVMALRWWPSTPLGRRMLLRVPRGQDVLPDSPRKRGLKDLINRVGHAKSQILPSGAVTIDGRTIDAVSEGMPIEAGQPVRVIEVRGNRVVVRPVDDEIPLETDPDPLARPIDTVGIDPFEEPPQPPA
jgi:membrane-bound ClpP family serine protease